MTSNNNMISKKAQRTGEILQIALETVEAEFNHDNTTFSLPPLDQVTVYSEMDSTSSDLSSVSSDEADNTPIYTKPRSIFGNYWDKKGGAPSLRRASTDDEVEEEEDSSSSSSSWDNTYEHNLKCTTTARKESTPRRKIFNNSTPCDSTPNLCLVDAMRKDVRKTKSTSALRNNNNNKRPSCLRSNLRYSGNKINKPATLTRERSDSSVSFSPQVDVLVYEVPKEVFAQKGWSSFFA